MTNSAIAPLQPANADINATLRALGLMEPEQQSTYNRAKINGSAFELGDDVYVSNQKTKAPAFIGRILDMPLEYQGIFLDEAAANIVGRPEMANRFCKSHYDKSLFPEEGGEYAEDGTECRKCPINPFIKKMDSPLENYKKCAWRGDILFQLSDTDGNPTEEDPKPWTLSLSTTGMIDLKGMRKSPEAGYVSETNFMQQLAHLGLTSFPEDSAENAIGKAAVALKMGNVLAEFRLVQAKSQDGSRSFPVVTMVPLRFVEGPPAVTAKITAGKPAVQNVTPVEIPDEDLPF